MYCDRGKTRKLKDGSEQKAVWEPQGITEQHGVTQIETNTTVSSASWEKKVLVHYRL